MLVRQSFVVSTIHRREILIFEHTVLRNIGLADLFETASCAAPITQQDLYYLTVLEAVCNYLYYEYATINVTFRYTLQSVVYFRFLFREARH